MRTPFTLLLALLIPACDDGSTAAIDPDTTPLDAAMDAMADTAPDPDAAPDVAVDAEVDAAVDAMVVDYDIPPQPELPDPPACDDSQPPVVMAHGLLAAGDTWSAHVARFAANGHCPDRYHAFDWNTLAMGLDNVALLDAFVDEVRALHGADRVDLFGHSAGGRLGYDYLADPARAAKVRRYVHTGSFANDTPPGPPDAPTETLNVWSDGDLIVPGAIIPGTVDAMIPGIDHYAVATDAAAFERVYTFLYDAPPETTERPPSDAPRIAGRVLTLGENAIDVGATVDLWPVEPATGQRTTAAPVARWIIEEDGHWGPYIADPAVPYELHVRPAGGGLPVRYYRPPFVGDDPLVYLRTLPTAGSTAGLILTQVSFDDRHTVLVVFSSTRALLGGVDTMTVGEESILSPELAPPEETLIALFVYDQRADGMPGATNPIFGQFPFLQMLDLPIPADAAAGVEVSLGAQRIVVPRWPSESEGAVIAVFDPTAM